MADINELILEKLKKYDEDVYYLAREALKSSENLPFQSVAEHLENVIRQIVRNREETE